MAEKYGYPLSDWNDAKEEMRQILIEKAKAGKTIAYSELTARLHTITFAPRSSAFAAILGEISTEENSAGRGMLTVIVVHKQGDMQPGPGFFELAETLGRDTSDIEKCWINEINWVFSIWKAQ